MKRYNRHIKQSIAKVEMIYPFASVLIQRERAFSVVSSTREEGIRNKPESIGFVYKVFTGLKYIEYAESELTLEALSRAEEYFINREDKEISHELKMEPGEAIIKDFEQTFIQDPELISKEEYLSLARKQREEIEKMSDKIQEATCSLGYSIKEEIYINRNKELHQKLRRFDVIYLAVFINGDESSEIYGGHAKIGGFEHALLDMDKVKKTIAKGEALLKAKRIKPGFYDAILSPSLSGMLAHEAFGHGTESDMFLKNRARGKYYLNKKVANEKLNMYDSPNMNHVAEANGSYFFDAEGTLASKREIIKEGILINSITDRYSALKLNMNHSSNSRVESYANKVYARMSNTFFEAGEDSLEEMIKSIKHGFILDNATNGMEDPKGWGMQLEALYAEEIVDGKLTGNIFSPIILTGYVPDILNSISGISKDFEISTLGYCGKGHKEWVKVTDGGPYLKLRARLA